MKRVLKILGVNYLFEYIEKEGSADCSTCVLSGRNCGRILSELYENPKNRPVCGVDGYYDVKPLNDDLSKVFIKVSHKNYEGLLKDLEKLGYSWRCEPPYFDLNPFDFTFSEEVYLVVEDVNKHILYVSQDDEGDGTTVVTSEDIAKAVAQSKSKFIDFKRIIEYAHEHGSNEVVFNIGGESFMTTRYNNAIIISRGLNIIGVYYTDEEYTVRKTHKAFSKLLGLPCGIQEVKVYYVKGKEDVNFSFLGDVEEYIYRLDNLFKPIRKDKVAKMVKSIIQK